MIGKKKGFFSQPDGSALGDLADKRSLKFRFITELSDTKPTLN